MIMHLLLLPTDNYSPPPALTSRQDWFHETIGREVASCHVVIVICHNFIEGDYYVCSLCLSTWLFVHRNSDSSGLISMKLE